MRICGRIIERKDHVESVSYARLLGHACASSYLLQGVSPVLRSRVVTSPLHVPEVLEAIKVEAERCVEAEVSAMTLTIEDRREFDAGVQDAFQRLLP